jgi:hypothetical protein
MNEEINHNVFKNISEKVNNVNRKIDKEIIDIMEDMNYEMDGFKAQMITSELTTDKIFKSINDKIYELEEFRTYQFEDFKALMNTTIDDKFCSLNEKIDENCSIMNSVTERIDNFELNSQNNNIVIGISYGNGSELNIPSFGNTDCMRANHGFETHKRLYVNILSDNIDLTYFTPNVSSSILIYTSELFKLKKLKKIKLDYWYIHSSSRCFGFYLIGECNQTINILNKDIFNPYRGRSLNSGIFEIYGSNYKINCCMGCIAKLLKLKVFNQYNGDDTEMVYEKVDKNCKGEYNFLELFFKEMGYISS